MNTSSLPIAIETDLIFSRFNGQVIEKQNYIVIRTPSNQGYHWGNYLVFQDAPSPGDETRWPLIFREEFADLPGVQHILFTWATRSEGSAVPAFCELGYSLENSLALVASSVHRPQKYNNEVSVRPLASDADWESAVQNQIMVNEKYEPNKFERFKRLQMANYRLMAEAGRGRWFGAFLNGKLVADLGVYFETEVGRFQSVVTHPQYRRLGICGRLVFDAANLAFSEFKVKRVAMVADADYHAAKIYESVGFLPVETTYCLASGRD